MTDCFLKDDYSGCVEKECKDMDPYNCQEFISKDTLKKCIVNPESQKCQLFTCSELNKYFCNYFGYIDDKYCIQNDNGCELKTCEESTNNCGAFNPKGNKYCVYKQDHNGCEYKSCEELSSGNCNLIYFNYFGENYNYDAVCTDNNDWHCVTKNCSLLTENCENLILENNAYKCISDGNGKCFPTPKNCEEMDPFQCGSYQMNENDYNLKKGCVDNIDNTTCIKTTCEELSNSECYKFNYYGNFHPEKCIPDGEKCKLVICEDLPKDKCDTFGYYNSFSKCISSGNNCKLVSCSEMPSDQCETFILGDPAYKCINMANRCTEFIKNCEELSVDMCYRYVNYYDDKICTSSEDNKKCELKDVKTNENKKEKSNMIKLSLYSVGLLLLF